MNSGNQSNDSTPPQGEVTAPQAPASFTLQNADLQALISSAVGQALASHKEESDREILHLHRQLLLAKSGKSKIADKLFDAILAFNGEIELGTLENFLKKAEEWNDESTVEETGKLKLIRSKLGSYASAVVATCATWDELKKQLIASFTHANQGFHVRDQLSDLRVTNGIREYTKRFNEVARLLGNDSCDEDTLIWFYVTGLPDDVRKWITCSLGKGELKNLKAVQDLAANQEGNSSRPNPPSKQLLTFRTRCPRTL